MHLEGRQSVLAALQARRRNIEVIFIKSGTHEERIKEILEFSERQNVPVKYCLPDELTLIAHGKTHGGIVALCSRKTLHTIDDLSEIFKSKPGFPFLILLEGVEDVQHLGYVLRSAEALGAHAVLLKKHLWDFDETALARTSSGAFERMPLIKLSDALQVRKFKRFNIRLWGCIAGAKRIMYDVDFGGPVALAVGGEKRGLSGKLRNECDGFVRIPMAPDSASSLALTHAACLLMGEVARQRYESTT